MEVFEDGALQAVTRIAARHGQAKLNARISPGDGGMENPLEKDVDHYWRTGTSALEVILQTMLVTGSTEFETILDFPCGFGRVARHLVAAFPDAHITACDIDPEMISFCAREFACTPLLSNVNFNELEFDEKFDLIWCGSLFSHLPEHKFRDCLALFSRSLAPNGMAVFTTHGRHSHRFGSDKYLPASRFAKVQREYEETGFGYEDYSDAPSAYTNNYGITLSAPAYIADAISADMTIRMVLFTERGWLDHQDVVAVLKKPVTD
jgi:SAM-dependent methyltransferase